jgi:hypothetical protein
VNYFFSLREALTKEVLIFDRLVEFILNSACNFVVATVPEMSTRILNRTRLWSPPHTLPTDLNKRFCRNNLTTILKTTVLTAAEAKALITSEFTTRDFALLLKAAHFPLTQANDIFRLASRNLSDSVTEASKVAAPESLCISGILEGHRPTDVKRWAVGRIDRKPPYGA